MPAPRRLILTLLLCAGAAWAQAEPPPEPELGRLLGGVVAIVSAMQTAIARWFGGDPQIQRLGKLIAVTLLALVASWGLIKAMLLGKGLASLAGDAVMPLLLTGLVFAACDAGLGLKIYRSMLTLAQMVPLEGARPTRIDPGFLSLQIIETFGRAGLNVWNIDFGHGLSLSPSALIGGIAKLCAGIGLMACGALGCATILMAQMAGALGALLAPVLIPWGIWGPTSFLFTGWLRFMITSGLQIVVTFAIGSMVAGVAASLIEPGRLIVTGGFVEALGMAGGLLLFALISLMLMMKAAELASGLVSGDGALSSSGWDTASRLSGLGVASQGAKLFGQKIAWPAAQQGARYGLKLAAMTPPGRKIQQGMANLKQRVERFMSGGRSGGAPGPAPSAAAKPAHQPLNRGSVQARRGGR